MAIDAAIEHIAQATGKAVHVAGYSQGGLFVYPGCGLPKV